MGFIGESLNFVSKTHIIIFLICGGFAVFAHYTRKTQNCKNLYLSLFILKSRF